MEPLGFLHRPPKKKCYECKKWKPLRQYTIQDVLFWSRKAVCADCLADEWWEEEDDIPPEPEPPLPPAPNEQFHFAPDDIPRMPRGRIVGG